MMNPSKAEAVYLAVSFAIIVFQPAFADANTALTPVLGISAPEIDFGLVTVGECTDEAVTLFNAVEDPASLLEITEIELTPPFSFVAPPALPVHVPGGGPGLSLGLRFCAADSDTVRRDMVVTCPNAIVTQVAIPMRGDGNLPPIPITGGPYAGILGSAIVFDGRSSIDFDGLVVAYSWSFGDGESASGAAVSHVFDSSGSFELALDVTDNAGAESVGRSVVTISTAAPHQNAVLDRIEFYAVVFIGQVTASQAHVGSASPGPEPCEYCTTIEVAAEEYLLGAGPDSVSLRVRAVDTDEMMTEILSNPMRLFHVPSVGARAVFWVERGAYAVITSPSQMWLVENGAIPPLGVTLQEVRRMIERKVDLGLPSTLRAVSAYAVLGTYLRSEAGCELIRETLFDCHTIEVNEQLYGPPIGLREISIRVPAAYSTGRLRAAWGGDYGLLFLSQRVQSGQFILADPGRAFFPLVGSNVVVGYRLVSGDGVDRIEQVTEELSEVLP